MMRKFIQILIAIAGIFPAMAQTQTDWSQFKKGLDFIIDSDLGRNGYYQQKPVAALMGEVAAEVGLEAVLALGDTHHYQGVQSTEDPLWLTNFELIYSHPELQVPWHPVLGNHEYRGNSQAVIDYSAISRRWEMPSRYYSKVFKGHGTKVKVIFLDTAPLIDKYRSKTETYPDAALQDVDIQLAWLDRELQNATEDWVIVVGHHPIYADTDKEDSERNDMQKRVDAILRKHRVDMYICGHIHNFQHIRQPDSNIDYIVNSSGSLSRPVQPTDGTVFCDGSAGFSLLTATPNSLALHMINDTGSIRHTVTRTK